MSSDSNASEFETVGADAQCHQHRDSDQKSGDAPEPAPQHHPDEEHHRIERQAASEDERLHDLAFDRGQRQVGERRQGDLPRGIERHRGRDQDAGEGHERTEVGHEIQNGRDGADQGGRRHAETHHRQRGAYAQAGVDQRGRREVAPDLALDRARDLHRDDAVAQSGQHADQLAQEQIARGQQEVEQDDARDRGGRDHLCRLEPLQRSSGLHDDFAPLVGRIRGLGQLGHLVGGAADRLHRPGQIAQLALELAHFTRPHFHELRCRFIKIRSEPHRAGQPQCHDDQRTDRIRNPQVARQQQDEWPQQQRQHDGDHDGNQQGAREDQRRARRDERDHRPVPCVRSGAPVIEAAWPSRPVRSRASMSSFPWAVGRQASCHAGGLPACRVAAGSEGERRRAGMRFAVTETSCGAGAGRQCQFESRLTTTTGGLHALLGSRVLRHRARRRVLRVRRHRRRGIVDRAVDFFPVHRHCRRLVHRRTRPATSLNERLRARRSATGRHVSTIRRFPCALVHGSSRPLGVIVPSVNPRRAVDGIIGCGRYRAAAGPC